MPSGCSTSLLVWLQLCHVRVFHTSRKTLFNLKSLLHECADIVMLRNDEEMQGKGALSLTWWEKIFIVWNTLPGESSSCGT
jgi:hypothetical protein